MTIVLWGIYNRKFTSKDIWQYIKDYYEDWFPHLPKYKAFNKRVAHLSDAFKTLCDLLMEGFPLAPDVKSHIIDSMPIALAKHSRRKRAKVAPKICGLGYCESKKLYYYGMKLSVIGQSNYKTLPLPKKMAVTSANPHDLTIAKDMLHGIYNIDLFGDKAYIDSEWQAHLLEHQGIYVLTPIKLKEGQERLTGADKYLSTAISRIKQPIESFFNWLQEKTNLEEASKVRSTKGLLSFVFSRIAVACLMIGGILI